MGDEARAGRARSRGAAALALGLAGALVAAAARAEPPPARPLAEGVTVREGACLAREPLLASLETWLGRGEVDPAIEVRVEELDDGRPRFVVSRSGRPYAERTFRAGAVPCADLRAAVALAIALAIDAAVLEGVLEPPPVAPTPEIPDQGPVHLPPHALPRRRAARPPPAVARHPAPHDRTVADAQGLALVGVLPSPGWGARGGLLVPSGAVELRAGLLAGLGVAAQVGRGEATVAMAAGEIGACLATRGASETLRGCAGVAAGQWSARGRGFDTSRSTELPWAAATLGLGGEVAITPAVALVGSVTAYAPVARPVLVVHDPAGAVRWRRPADPAGLALGLGLSVRFR
ncbi:MAG: hypothetical protein IT376_12090 [Polyangiaceae bacterium]|nr:hypothetical protein [Polyangiaceae bacterium]